MPPPTELQFPQYEHFVTQEPHSNTGNQGHTFEMLWSFLDNDGKAQVPEFDGVPDGD